MFDLIDFFIAAKAVAPPGQQVWEKLTPDNSTAIYTFTVPTGVRLLSMVCAGFARVTVDGVNVCSSSALSFGTGDGTDAIVGFGGDGGAPGVLTSGTGSGHGGGGAGGYTGNGGTGASHSGGRDYPGSSGGNGSGGGGGGGGAPSTMDGVLRRGAAGGGVGLKGLGASGGGGAPGAGGGGGSGGGAGNGSWTVSSGLVSYGGTYGGGNVGEYGAPTRWVNDVPVTAGSVVRVFLRTADNSSAIRIASSGVRFLWGGGRSYPSNAGDL